MKKRWVGVDDAAYTLDDKPTAVECMMTNFELVGGKSLASASVGKIQPHESNLLRPHLQRGRLPCGSLSEQTALQTNVTCASMLWNLVSDCQDFTTLASSQRHQMFGS